MKDNNQPCNFFCLLEDGAVKKIPLTNKVIPSIKKIFIDGNTALFNDVEEINFDGNYNIAENEILYVEMALPKNLVEAIGSPIETPNLDLKNDIIKALFWHENGETYFQNFDKRKLLKNKNVMIFSKDTFDRLENDAFVVDDFINAVHKDGKFFFKSFVNANKIFSLADYYREATNDDIVSFAGHNLISLDQDWFTNNSNSIIRKQITLLQKSKTLDSADTKKIKKHANKFKLAISLDDEGKICFPNDKKQCKEILLFLNEQYWIGLITGTKFKTTSKRKVKEAV